MHGQVWGGSHSIVLYIFKSSRVIKCFRLLFCCEHLTQFIIACFIFCGSFGTSYILYALVEIRKGLSTDDVLFVHEMLVIKVN